MKNAFVFIMLFFLVNLVKAQNIELSGGINLNRPYDFDKEKNTGITADYKAKFGYSIATSTTFSIPGLIPMRLTLDFDAYKSELFTSQSALAAIQETDVTFTRYSLGFGVFPIHFSIQDDIQLSFGSEFDIQLGAKTEGFQTLTVSDEVVERIDMADYPTYIHSKVNIALSGRISYKYEIADDWYVVPIYKLYVAISDEFKNIETNPRSIRHVVRVGVLKEF